MGLIGYTCSYIPVELLSATGFLPYRLIHGTISFSEKGEEVVKVDACPLVKANLGYLLENEKKFVGVIGATGCDLARRQLEVIAHFTSLPVHILNNPRTDNPKIFKDEIEELVKFLEKLGQKKLTPELVAREIERWENFREGLRVIDQQRKAKPSLFSTSDFHKLCISYHKGNPPANFPSSTSSPSTNPRVYLLGSPISYEANPFLQLLEKDLQIVGDFNCGISRPLLIKIREKNLIGIKEAYYHQPPCIFKRPNKKFYEWVSKELKERHCQGIVAWTLDYCDNYEFELSRMEKTFGLPFLRIRSDFSFSHISQWQLRIAAFAESIKENIYV